MATTGKIAEVMFEKSIETYETQDMMLDLTMFDTPDPTKQQNTGNVIWTPVQQHAPIIEGFDISGEETDIIEETYPKILGVPKNDFVKQRADQMRDIRFWERRGEQSGRRQASELNKLTALAVAIQGSKHIRTNATSGYDIVGEAQALLNETQQMNNGRNFVFNDRDNLKFAKDLAGRQTLQGRPEEVWKTGQIAKNIAGFDVFTGSFLPNIIGGASPAATVTGAQSFKPEAGSSNADTGEVFNIDYRVATIPVSDSTSYNVGDKVSIGAIQSIGLDDKSATGQLMTFTIVSKPTGTSIKVYPKPIALDDAALSVIEKAYANVDTTIPNAAVVARLNIDASAKTNLFWDKGAVEITGGTIPAELFAQYDGMKVITHTMSNGQTMYMVYDGDIGQLTFRYRLFTWYGITVCNPQNAGTLTTF